MAACCPAAGDERRDGSPRVVPAVRRAGPAHRQMAEIPAGTYNIGSDDSESRPEDGERPVRAVTVRSFWIDRYAVSNRQFAHFVKQTGYLTDAERFGWSYVFYSLVHPGARDAVRDGIVAQAPWWLAVEGACWRAPYGPGSGIGELAKHPVVHISWTDALAYANWVGKRLPTECEWEIAARGGLDQARYPWGEELTYRARHRCNIWQGRFPYENTGEDGYIATAPVNAYRPNCYGLYNTSGNVWEWCADWWSPTWHVAETAETRIDPAGPCEGNLKVIRGGSYLCHHSYCNRYRVSARTCNTPESTTGHLGFRCALSG